jgi:hypothetical protein
MWTLLFACAEVWSGQLASSAGTPLAAIPVTAGGVTVETGSDGGFSLPPASALTFAYGGVAYTAHTRQADPYRLPPVRKALLHCPPEPCALVLSWPSSGPLESVVERACKPGDELKVEAPVGVPSATCDGRTLFVDDRQADLFLLPEGRETTVRIVARDGGTLPSDCEAWIDAVPARPAGPGAWVGRSDGAGAFAGGRCGGRGLTPVAIDGPEVVLGWRAAGPTLRLGERAPWATDLVVLDPVGWTLLVHPVDGVFLLPELPEGTYRVEVRGPDAVVSDTVLLPDAPAAGIRFAPGGDRVLYGTWRVVGPDGGASEVPVVE